MSSGASTFGGSVDLQESAADVAPVGTTRIRRKGGILELSIDGASFIPIVTTNVKSTLLNSPNSTISVSGLVPAVDGNYNLEAEFIIAQANTTIKFQPNGSDTNCNSCSTNNFIGAVRNDTTWTIGENALPAKTFAAGTRVRIVGTIAAKVGRRRLINLFWYLYTGGATNVFGQIMGYWVDESTPLASFVAVSAGPAGGYDVGTYMLLTPVPQPG